MNTPNRSTLIKVIERDNDERGSILSIVDNSIKNVSIIECKAGVIRSNHYHREDYHYMYVLQGEIDYFYTDLERKHINYINVNKDEIIFTPKMEIHATHFPIETKLRVSSMLPRDQLTYENDTVRVEFINQENLNSMIEKYGQN